MELLKKQQEKERNAQADATTKGQTAVPMAATTEAQSQTPPAPGTPAATGYQPSTPSTQT